MLGKSVLACTVRLSVKCLLSKVKVHILFVRYNTLADIRFTFSIFTAAKVLRYYILIVAELGLREVRLVHMLEKCDYIDNARAQRIRRVAELQDRRCRQRHGRFIVEGPQCVREAVLCMPECLLDIYIEVESDDDLQPVSSVVTQIRDQALTQAPNVYMHYVSSAVMQAMSKDSQGIVAVGKLDQMQTTLSQLSYDGKTQREGLALAALWQVRDPGNAGTIIRTADAAGINALLLVDHCVDPFNPKLLRSTAGSIFHIPVVQVTTDDFFIWVKQQQLSVIAADVYGTDDSRPISLPELLQTRADSLNVQVLLFGNEARGLPTEILKKVDQIVSIPIFGKAESLNLATSAAVMLYTIAMSSRFGTM